LECGYDLQVLDCVYDLQVNAVTRNQVGLGLTGFGFGLTILGVKKLNDTKTKLKDFFVQKQATMLVGLIWWEKYTLTIIT
jgi:hypothetical protein